MHASMIIVYGQFTRITSNTDARHNDDDDDDHHHHELSMSFVICFEKQSSLLLECFLVNVRPVSTSNWIMMFDHVHS
jgi:hypothetical protein